MLHLLRCLYFYAGYFQFSYGAHHVPGVTNVAADALSLGNMLLFHSFILQALQSIVQQELRNLLTFQQPDWESLGWIALFRATLLTPYLSAHDNCISQPSTDTSFFVRVLVYCFPSPCSRWSWVVLLLFWPPSSCHMLSFGHISVLFALPRLLLVSQIWHSPPFII